MLHDQLVAILASPRDHTARLLAEDLCSFGIRAVVVSRAGSLQSTVHLERDGSTHCTIELAGEVVTGVINRGFPASRAQTMTGRFIDAERHAATWTSLALTPVPVVNRPTIETFLPPMPVTAIAHEAGLGAGRIGLTTLPSRVSRRRNVHLVRTGQQARDGMDVRGEVLRTTALDRSALRRIVIAANCIFDLDGASRRPDRRLSNELERVAAAVTARNATFAYVVLEGRRPPRHVVFASPIPRIESYQPFRVLVHRALAALLVGQ